jgi:hypothetical protein
MYALQVIYGSLREFIRRHVSWLSPGFDSRKDSATVRRHKAALFSLNQFGANLFDFLLRSAGFANEVVHNIAFAGVFIALNLCQQPSVVWVCEGYALAGHTRNLSTDMMHIYTKTAPLTRKRSSTGRFEPLAWMVAALRLLDKLFNVSFRRTCRAHRLHSRAYFVLKQRGRYKSVRRFNLPAQSGHTPNFTPVSLFQCRPEFLA